MYRLERLGFLLWFIAIILALLLGRQDSYSSYGFMFLGEVYLEDIALYILISLGIAGTIFYKISDRFK